MLLILSVDQHLYLLCNNTVRSCLPSIKRHIHIELYSLLLISCSKHSLIPILSCVPGNHMPLLPKITVNMNLESQIIPPNSVHTCIPSKESLKHRNLNPLHANSTLHKHNTRSHIPHSHLKTHSQITNILFKTPYTPSYYVTFSARFLNSESYSLRLQTQHILNFQQHLRSKVLIYNG
jgi:hypothetical protein